MKKIMLGIGVGVAITLVAAKVRAVTSPIYALTPVLSACSSSTPANLASCQSATQVILTLNPDGTVTWSKPW